MLGNLMRALAIALLLPAAACAQAPVSDQWRAIEVTATPTALGAEEVGALRFIGGLELASGEEAFGGISDIAVQMDGAFLAITDAGHWLRGRIAFDEAGAPTGVSGVEIASMRNEAGEPFASKQEGDSEGMAILPDGRVAVSFEQNQVLRLYDLSQGPFAAAVAGPVLAEREGIPGNSGLEALAAFEDGRLLVGAENVSSNGILWIAAPGSEEPAPRLARYALGLGFGLVDLDRLPGGDFVALERFYAPVIGNRIRVARISAADLAAPHDGLAPKTELALLTPPLALDNFEGISVVPQEDGSVRLVLVSDDNFNDRQRTLIYVFSLPAPEAPAEEAP